MASSIILEDTFVVQAVNPDGAVYQRVSRLVCNTADTGSGVHSGLVITTDINCEEFPVLPGERLTITLARSLELSSDAKPPTVYDHSVYHRETLLDRCDYAMNGLVYKYNASPSGNTEVFVSFGGLLAKIVGTPAALQEIRYNESIFLLIKKVGK